MSRPTRPSLTAALACGLLLGALAGAQPPPAPAAGGQPDAPAAEPSEVERLRAELEAAHARIAELEAQLQTAADPAKRLREQQEQREREVEALQDEMAALPPDQAAARWLAFADAYFADGGEAPVQQMMYYGESDRSFTSVVAAVPTPRAWPAIEQQLQARPADDESVAQLQRTLLLAVAATLNGQPPEVGALLDALRPHYEKKDEWQQDQELRTLEEYLGARLNQTDDAQQIAALLGLVLKVADREETWNELELPDLVTLIGAEEAERVLTAALSMKKRSIALPEGEQTRALARRIAREKIEDLSAPPWDLTLGMEPEAEALYLAILARFAPHEAAEAAAKKIITRMAGMDDSDADEGSRAEADGYHFLRLVADGKAQEATDWLRRNPQVSLPYGALRELSDAGAAQQVYDLFRTLLIDNPNLPLWQPLGELSVRVGRAEEVAALLADALEDPSLTPAQRLTLRKRYAEALLASDRVDDGVAVLRDVAQQDDWPNEQQKREALREIGRRLTRIGHLLQRDEWTDEGLTLIERASEIEPDNSYSSYQTIETAGLLLQLDRPADAEALLRKELAEQGKVSTERMWSMMYGYGGAQDVLVELMNVLVGQQRYEEALALLDEQPGWGATDLAKLLRERASDQTPLGYLVAQALVKLDRTDEARPILNAMMRDAAGYDPLYELYVRVEGEGAAAALERLAQRDPFQERPLIWLAQLRLVGGDAANAEQTIRRAIAIDPSDGEQGKGHRMRAYAVLADTLRQQGKLDEAQVFDGAVKAVRHAEHADDFYEAGLLTRAVAMYTEALDYFADAYCIQSRLAVQLVEQGRLDEAEQHYRRAFELMPDSFGRMESHCFGCEGVFDGPLAQTVAERVFQRLADERPDSPQVHYLLGYLRQSQQRYPEAVASFRRAVELDPMYLNAWTHLDDLPAAFVPAELRDRAVFELLRIDPRGQHSRPNVQTVRDLPALWRLLDELRTDDPDEPIDSLYPLPAVAAFRQKLAQRSPQYAGMFADGQSPYDYLDPAGQRDPGEALASNVLIAPLAQLIDQTVQLQMLEGMNLDLDALEIE